MPASTSHLCLVYENFNCAFVINIYIVIKAVLLEIYFRQNCFFQIKGKATIAEINIEIR